MFWKFSFQEMRNLIKADPRRTVCQCLAQGLSCVFNFTESMVLVLFIHPLDSCPQKLLLGFDE